MRFKFMLPVLMALTMVANAKAKRAPASIEDDSGASGVFMKIEGLNGNSHVPGYEEWFKLDYLDFYAGRSNPHDKILNKPAPPKKDAAKDKDEKKPEVNGMASANTTRKFDRKSSLPLQKLAFSQKPFTVRVRIVKASSDRSQVAVEYVLSDAFVSSYSVNHMAPDAYGGAPTPDQENITFGFSGFKSDAPGIAGGADEKAD